MTSPLMKFTLQDRDTLHELDQPLKELAYVSNHWGPLLSCLGTSNISKIAPWVHGAFTLVLNSNCDLLSRQVERDWQHSLPV